MFSLLGRAMRPAAGWRANFPALLTITLATGVGWERCAAQECAPLNGGLYVQDFNTLAASGTSNTILPLGFAFDEAGGNTTYAADDGDLATGNTYSYGTNAERAFGELSSGTVRSTLGACFLNNTGFTITTFSVSYRGEQWRLGTADEISDRLDFQYSTNATALDDGDWTNVDALDFITPNNRAPVGPKNGNTALNRTTLSPVAIVPPGGLADGEMFFIRWRPTNITGDDDGLAIDDFRLSYAPSADFDEDGDVDGADFLSWQRGLGRRTVEHEDGDADVDGDVDAVDLAIWRGQFGTTLASSAAPEPAVSIVASSAVAAFATVWRRKLARGTLVKRHRALPVPC